MKQVANILRAARIKKGLSQTETGRILRLSEQYISRMEGCQCPIPIKQTRRLQKLFGISTEVLMEAYAKDYWEKLKKKFNA